jgi:hypothetical protein
LGRKSKYSPEFQAAAVRLLAEPGATNESVGREVKSQRVCNSASSSRPIPQLASMSGWPTSSIGTRASMSTIDSGRK